jgi:hypothetical protein
MLLLLALLQVLCVGLQPGRRPSQRQQAAHAARAHG